MGRQRFAQIGLALATTLVVVLVLDRVLLAAFPLGSVVYRAHPEWLYEYIPGASKFYIHMPENGGEWIRVRINREGLRGEEIASQEGARRILVLGDSFVAAEFSPVEETYVARLAEELGSSKGIPVQAINAGLVGAGPGMMTRRLDSLLAKWQPDVVVMVVNAGNDFGDLVRNKLYRVRRGGEVVVRNPPLGPAMARSLESTWVDRSGWGQLIRAAWRGLSQRWKNRSAESGRDVPRPGLRAARLVRQRAMEYRAFTQADPMVRNLFDDTYDAGISFHPDSKEARDKRRLLTAVLAHAARKAHEAGADLLVVAIPSPIDTTEEHYGLVADWDALPEYRRSNLTDAIVDSASNASLPVVNLFPAMAGDAEPESLFYFAGNDHWTARGQALAARLTAERILELDWLGEASAPGRPNESKAD